MIGLRDLHWFPKPYGAGDNDGRGNRLLLGNPDVEPPSLLVRETAQNSWDARLPGAIPTFELRFRHLDHVAMDVLRWNVFGQRGSASLGLAAALDSPTLCAIEVVDRGTKGLGGPTRNDIDPPAGEPTDYIDFVLNIGAPPDEGGRGGGTYGFGKTAAYLASTCSTIIIWSRARDRNGVIVERFIASAMGAAFSLDGQKFTGRQWWGLPSEAPETAAVFRVEPVVGDEAHRLGEAVFERHFAEGETGTSILILQPRFEGRPVSSPEQIDALLAAWAKGISRNLWPKLDQAQPAERRMDIRLVRDGVDVQIDDASLSPTIAAAAKCLAALRALEAGSTPDPQVTVVPIDCSRPIQRLGHVALMKYLHSDGQEGPVSDDSLIFMRSAAELVVWEESLGPTSDGFTKWIGVFKPLADLDQAFADSEPPAHDAWNYNSLEDRRSRTFVKLAVQRARESANNFRKPNVAQVEAGQSRSTGRLSKALAGLVVGGQGTAAAPSARKRGGATGNRGQTGKATRVKVLEALPIPRSSMDHEGGRQSTCVVLELEGPQGLTVEVYPSRLALAVDGGVMDGSNVVRLERWAREDGCVAADERLSMEVGTKSYAEISYPVGLAIDFSFAVQEEA